MSSGILSVILRLGHRYCLDNKNPDNRGCTVAERLKYLDGLPRYNDYYYQKLPPQLLHHTDVLLSDSNTQLG